MFFNLGRRKASTLIELLVYISLSTIICVLFFGILNNTWSTVLQVDRVQERRLELVLAGDVLRRDLLSASMKLQDWNERSFIFKKLFLDVKNKIKEEWVFWYVNDYYLMRAGGTYDVCNNVWKSNDISIVCRNIAKIQLNLEKNGEFVSAANVTLVSKESGLVQNELFGQQIYVAMRNRTFV